MTFWVIFIEFSLILGTETWKYSSQIGVGESNVYYI